MTTNHIFNFSVTPQDVDFTRRITLVALGNYILNTAGAAATLNNFGLEKLIEENLAWVVSRLAVEMQRYPAQYEEFSIETWVEDYGKLFTTRNFKILDKEGTVIGTACSIWAIIDLTTRRPYNLHNKIEWNRFATGIGAGMEKPVKVEEILIKKSATAYHTVAYSDIDFNQHTNSTKYVQWFLDTLDLAKFEQKNIARFDVNYIHEARFGDKTALFCENSDEKTLCEIRNGENKILCKIKLLWK
ncbi:MAG: acyl-[acyl-carrier-protein] thioesterase [Prevotellaceae bacterium]|jgi:acyl-ACP thioesterase|nr:acyl-[acyl-carrier-protein] thioesterase [Prevotellaceae bacterium]